jgi:hypothetical protein
LILFMTVRLILLCLQGHAKKPQINWTRTLHMSTSFGLTSGFLCHFWYNYLDKVLPGRGIRVVVQKIVFDQVRQSMSREIVINFIFLRFCSVLSASLPACLWLGGLRIRELPPLSARLCSLGGGCTWLSGSSGLQHSLSTSTSSPPSSGCSMTTSSA